MERPPIQIDITMKFDIPAMQRILPPPQLHAVLAGIAQVIAAGK